MNSIAGVTEDEGDEAELEGIFRFPNETLIYYGINAIRFPQSVKTPAHHSDIASKR
jgi:hypothetical protein